MKLSATISEITNTDKAWPRVTWEQRSLELTAEAVRLTNPFTIYDDDEACASYIRSTAERELYRQAPVHGLTVSTGGWQVVFIAGDTANTFSAWPSLTPYSVIRYVSTTEKL